MITYYMFGYWAGWFRTKDSTQTPEEFEAYLKEQDLKREGAGIFQNKDGKQVGNITNDTTGGEFNPDPVVGGKIGIKYS